MSARYWKLGILGWPLGYSLSPLMHAAALKACGLEGEYKEYPVQPDDLWGWLEKVNDLGLSGFNVTMPYKKSVFAWVISSGGGRLGRLESIDRVIGALNTIVIEDGRPVGYNTDGEGFLRTLVEPPRALDLTDKHALLLGAGGAAQAIAVTLALKGKLGKLTIWNRHPDKAESLAVIVKALVQVGRSKVKAAAVPDLRSKPIELFDLIINATPAGMKGHEEKLINTDRLKRGQIVYDLVYEPRETALAREARIRGCDVITGDEMLAGQGAAAFELWTGVKGMLPVMRKALDEHLRAH